MKYLEEQLSDEALVQHLSGFENHYINTNGIKLHYVKGGTGKPLFLLPGWPQTWWSYHKLMNKLADFYTVIVVDIRGMGTTDKPTDGYDKKSMAKDIYELIIELGYDEVFVAGHDIGASVAYSLASYYPDKVAKLIILDTPPADENMYRLPMLPLMDLTDKSTGYTYPWWVAFNQIDELPEKLLKGRYNVVLDYIFDNLCFDKGAITDFDRAVYTNAYERDNAISSSNKWYSTFPKDIADSKDNKVLKMPVLGIGGSGYKLLEMALPGLVENLQLIEIKDCGHFVCEEAPDATFSEIINFLGS